MTTSTNTATGAWKLDPTHSIAEFAVKHMMVSTVKGRFHNVAARIELNKDEPERSSVVAEVDVASVDTGLEMRDSHLRSDDFFSAERFPKITFRSNKVEPAAEDRWFVTGELTIRDVTREVVLDVEYGGHVADP